ncbi:hypothetical protein LMG28614_01436 [Paraburkholderia ultramafica]|uniref:Uncharacterized protein n=1 Tax=Paraburkholderia ultramafica TaxID=1544867 RepID=A0A6S7B1M8_9BURK|nr:hypothetical protein LMG28614_01436 [Paraburkholderia ultramafica]
MPLPAQAAANSMELSFAISFCGTSTAIGPRGLSNCQDGPFGLKTRQSWSEIARMLVRLRLE